MDARPAFVDALASSLPARLVETHISIVLLAAADAYKIKKPVRLGFVDYASIDARRFFCEEELRLNARLAPGLYLRVVRITGSAAAPAIEGDGPVIDFAVHMRRFPEDALFSRKLQDGSLAPAQVDALADRLASFHLAIPRDPPDAAFGSPEVRLRAALSALDGAASVAVAGEVGRMRGWMEKEGARLASPWTARRRAGFVRECHGDLHLDNIIALDGEVTAFDAVEFDPALRWIDVVDDLAFAVMDFEARGAAPSAWRLLNRWLDATGDHAGVPLLRFACVYRALVRAQVSALRGNARMGRRYVDSALRWMQAGAPALTITHGLPGSGKTFQSQRLLEAEGAIRLRSDVERKRLFGLAMHDDSRARGVDIYGVQAGERTYAHLLDTARELLRAGWPVILDAAFLRAHERARARALAAELHVPLWILDCDAPPDVLRERLRARRNDASEADERVLELLHAKAEPLSPDERALIRR